MKKMFLYFLIFVAFICVIVSISGYAVTEEEIKAAVDSSSKETVSGKLFVWFLCAVAFMKVSQKIDSIMSSLGVSVGRTGGSLLAEAMIAGKTIGASLKSVGGISNLSKGNLGTGGARPAGRGSLIGGIGRKMTDGATGAVTGNGDSSGGVLASIGRKMYQSSVGKGGTFATDVIGSIARGEISKMGTISGADGKMAMKSYFGYNSKSNVDSKVSKSSDVSLGASGEGKGSEYSREAIIGFSASCGEFPPRFSDIEMGGGRITGTETSADYPDGIQFALYDAEKYVKPEGKFETVTAIDNSKWYKQYATPAVERTPYMNAKGKVKYNEKIVERIPKAPMRKDKM